MFLSLNIFWKQLR